ncbi:protein of unknown function DUF4283 [Dillenia turbinata]|uniref:DUF4283 domain-containing protein n=1 Tax=Dillenia turbinata TaxID=194707 RepID=A0AAN8YYT0_9MAGN
MASSSRNVGEDLDELCTRMNINVEEEGLAIDDTVVEIIVKDFRWYLVGMLHLTNGHEKYIWLLFRGHEKESVDIRRIIDSGPWTFDNHTLLVRRLGNNEQPGHVPLFQVQIWVQIYKLPIGFMSKKIACNIGNHIDPNNYTSNWCDYKRICVAIDSWIVQEDKPIAVGEDGGTDNDMEGLIAKAKSTD